MQKFFQSFFIAFFLGARLPPAPFHWRTRTLSTSSSKGSLRDARHLRPLLRACFAPNLFLRTFRDHSVPSLVILPLKVLDYTPDVVYSTAGVAAFHASCHLSDR